jgi:hypothetical protein
LFRSAEAAAIAAGATSIHVDHAASTEKANRLRITRVCLSMNTDRAIGRHPGSRVGAMGDNIQPRQPPACATSRRAVDQCKESGRRQWHSTK